MMLSLWLYAITLGISSAREIARRTMDDRAFRWLVGDLRVSHDTVAEFRVGHRAALEKLFADVVASLLERELITLKVVAQDGMRVRASASAPSFRRHQSLLECREQAELHLKAVLAEADEPGPSAGEQAAREAAARDYQRRVEAAIETVKALESQRKPSASPARASTTDSDARVMKIADGGFRPAYNVKAATVGDAQGGPRTIVGIQVSNVGSDMNAVGPMLDEIEKSAGGLPEKLLADANHAGHEGVKVAAERGVELIVPVPERSRRPGREADTHPAVVAWKTRMDTEEARVTYRQRAGLAELTNAHMRRAGMERFLVRGLEKVSAVALMTALALNILAHGAKLID